MATTKPRITITLEPAAYNALRGLSTFSGEAMSSIVSEFLMMALPTLERMAATAQRISEAKGAELERIRTQIHDAQEVFEPLAMATLAQADFFLGQVAQEAPRGASATRGASGATVDSSPRTNRGVTPTPAKPLKPKPGAAAGEVRGRSQKTEKRGGKRAI